MCVGGRHLKRKVKTEHLRSRERERERLKARERGVES